jgi:hypothetical protein
MPKFRISEQYYGNGINVAVGTGCGSMTSPLYERDGLDFRPPDGKTRERQFEIIAFVSGCEAPSHKQPPGLKTTNLK